MFQKILIANRAEIACRIIRTAKRLGIQTVAVYSDPDADSLHVTHADEAIHIGAAPARESYLNIEKIIAACKTSGAQAVHPGYGFLSENADFARALEAENIAFIGPKTYAIEAMGDKIASKKIAQKAGVNIIPGHADVIADAKQAVAVAAEIGYPVMLKASAGGGGKGMRVAYTDAETRDGFTRATNEAESSFGDGRILIEKFIEKPRHIEIQIIADNHGNILTLGERECSLQRRHQKVIEEAPSPFITAATRNAVYAQARALAQAVDYCSAGTVEMIVDAKQNFYFLEMNTRLQVEHPVTEEITELDLVELMLRVAAGEKLPLTQRQVKINGWAIEARIYAENTARNFLPSSGRLVGYIPPPQGDGETRVRVDTGVSEGAEVSRFYDPMIAKLVTWGADRAQAITQMRLALDGYYLRGIDTNQSFLANLAAHPHFQKGDFSTNFIAEHYPDGFDDASVNPNEIPKPTLTRFIVAAAVIHHRIVTRATGISGQLPGYGRTWGQDWVVVLGGTQYPVTVRRAEDQSATPCWQVQYAGDNYTLAGLWRFTEPVYRTQINGEVAHFQVERHGAGYQIGHSGAQFRVAVLSPRTAELHALMPHKAAPDLSDWLLSPMPGLLVSLQVADGEKVKRGQELAVIEAMKMENSLRAENDAVVEKVLVSQGAVLEAEQPILQFVPKDVSGLRE